MAKTKIGNPHLQILLFSIFLVFYNYYEVALTLNHASNYYDNLNVGYLYFVFALTPFTFSSLFRPFGGLIMSWWQKKSANFILPYLFIIYSIIGLIVNITTAYVSNHTFAYIILGMRIFQGVLIGGILPQYLLYFYERSYNQQQRILYSSTSFMVVSCAVICSELVLHFAPPGTSYWLSIIVSIVFILIACQIFSYKDMWINFQLETIPVTQSLSLRTTLKNNYAPIIRLSFFITFMASINSFFLTVMPFYMIHYLHYKAKDVFSVIIIIVFFGLIGYMVGTYYHSILGKRFHIIIGLILKIILFFLFRMYIEHNLLLIFILGSACLFAQGVMAAKIPLMLNSIFPPSSRLDGVTITFNLSWGIMFGFSGFIILNLVNYFHNLYLPSLAIMLFSYLSIISLWFTPEKDFYCYLNKT